MAETFVISRGAADEAEVVLVELTHEGVTGYGEATPIERYDESAESAFAFVEEAAPLLGDDPFALEAIDARLRERPGEQAGNAALGAPLRAPRRKRAGPPGWDLLWVRPTRP